MWKSFFFKRWAAMGIYPSAEFAKIVLFSLQTCGLCHNLGANIGCKKCPADIMYRAECDDTWYLAWLCRNSYHCWECEKDWAQIDVADQHQMADGTNDEIIVEGDAIENRVLEGAVANPLVHDAIENAVAEDPVVEDFVENPAISAGVMDSSWVRVVKWNKLFISMTQTKPKTVPMVEPVRFIISIRTCWKSR